MSTWSCGVCTFDNPASFLTCKVCGTPQDIKKDTDTHWQCKACTYQNPSEVNICEMCAKSKEGTKSSKKNHGASLQGQNNGLKREGMRSRRDSNKRGVKVEQKKRSNREEKNTVKNSKASTRGTRSAASDSQRRSPRKPQNNPLDLDKAQKTKRKSPQQTVECNKKRKKNENMPSQSQAKTQRSSDQSKPRRSRRSNTASLIEKRTIEIDATLKSLFLKEYFTIQKLPESAIQTIISFVCSGTVLNNGWKVKKEKDIIKSPHGIAVMNDEVYVSDTANHRICVFSRSTNRFLRQWGSQGTGNGQLQFPLGITIDHDRREALVCDHSNYRICVFSLDGRFLRAFGNTGPEDEQLHEPCFIAVTTSKTGQEVYISDSPRRIRVYGEDGKFLRGWGSEGKGKGEFLAVEGIAVVDNEVYICDGGRSLLPDKKGNDPVPSKDIGNHRVCVFTTKGRFKRQWGSEGTGDDQLLWPTGLVVNGEEVFVCDSRNNRISVFDRDGRYLRTWGDKWDVQLNYPMGIAACNDQLVVTDTKE